MGHEGLYNFFLAAMGNVVSAILMYALQAAWLCQRLIDQDYRQNHGSRLTPILEDPNLAKPIEIVPLPQDMYISKNSHHKTKSPRQVSRPRKQAVIPGRSQRSGDVKRRKRYHHRKHETISSYRRLNSSHPYLGELYTLNTTVEYINGLGQNLGLRRAFSDINISSSYFEFKNEFCDSNQNYLSNRNIDETSTAVTNQDFLRLIFTKGYVT